MAMNISLSTRSCRLCFREPLHYRHARRKSSPAIASSAPASLPSVAGRHTHVLRTQTCACSADARATTFSLRDLLHTLLTIAVAIFVVPVAALIAVLGALAAPLAAAGAAPDSSPSSVLTSSKAPTRVSTSEALSSASGVSTARVHHVLHGRWPAVLSSLPAGPPLATSPPSPGLATSASQPQRESSPGVELAGDGKDRVGDVLRVLESRLDNAISGAQGTALRAIPTLSTTDEEEARAARDLAVEAVELVKQVWLDARGSGLDRERWVRESLAEVAVRPPRTRVEAHLLIKGFLSRGPADPYTRFIPPEEFKQLTKYDVSGVGVNVVGAEEYVAKMSRPLPRGLSPSDGGVWVVGLIKGLAAEQAGVRQGDEVVAVDGMRVAGLTPFQVASLLRAAHPQPPGAAARDAGVAEVEVVHANGKSEVVKVARGKNAAVVNPVGAVGLRGDAGYVRLKTFNARAAPELRAAVREAEARGAQQIVLDLTDNRGGLVAEAVEIARLFLPAGSTVVATKTVNAQSVTRLDASAPVTALPVVLLVNGRTASASEILAGALRDNCRAVVAGTTTFGKGLIQSVYELSDGSGMAVTVGKYFTPSGVDIDRSGIVPDFQAAPQRADAQARLDTCVVPKR